MTVEFREKDHVTITLRVLCHEFEKNKRILCVKLGRAIILSQRSDKMSILTRLWWWNVGSQKQKCLVEATDERWKSSKKINSCKTIL